MNPGPSAQSLAPQPRAKARRPRRWLPYLGALVIIAGLVAGLWPRPTPVETARVTTGPLRVTVNEEGKTRIRQRYLVSAPVAGQLRRITLKAGATVEAGQVVAALDPISPALLDPRSRQLAEARRQTASDNLEKARAAHVFATNELRRFQKLFRDQAVSTQEIEAAQWREAAAAKELAASASSLKEAEAQLAEFAPVLDGVTLSNRPPIEVRAPVRGRVLRLLEESARVVATGAALLEVGDPSDLEVVVELLSRDGAALSPGTPVEFEQWGGGLPLAGRIRLVEPAAFTKISALGVEEQRVNVVVDLLTPPEQRAGLGDNFRVEAHVVTWETNRTLKAPAGALFRRGEEWSVFIVLGGQARLRPVKVGRSSGTETQVLEGLKEADEVLVYVIDGAARGRAGVREIEDVVAGTRGDDVEVGAARAYCPGPRWA